MHGMLNNTDSRHFREDGACIADKNGILESACILAERERYIYRRRSRRVFTQNRYFGAAEFRCGIPGVCTQNEISRRNVKSTSYFCCSLPRLTSSDKKNSRDFAGGAMIFKQRVRAKRLRKSARFNSQCPESI